MEQIRRSGSVPLRRSLLVATQLPHCLRPPHVQQRRRLCLHNYQRDSVDEKRQVRDHHALVVLGAALLVAATHAELCGDHELVEATLRVFEVEDTDCAGIPASRRVHGQGHPIGQVLVDALVAGHAGGVNVFQVKDDAIGLLLRHPLVQPQQRRSQSTLEQHLPLVSALRRHSFTRNVGPPQLLEEPARRLLGVVVLVELGGGSHGASF